MNDITTLTKAGSNTNSLRVTVPIGIVKQFDLTNSDKFEWVLVIDSKGKKEMRIIPRKV